MPNKLGNIIRPASERFFERVAINPDGCWLWTGGLSNVGYGQFYKGRASLDDTGKTYAHRWSYEYHVGPIPDGLQLDHLCRNRACVRPEHLEPVTIRENLLRSEGPSAIHAKKTHCPAGHPYAGDNLYSHPRKNMRSCRACGRERAAVKYRRLRAEQLAKEG